MAVHKICFYYLIFHIVFANEHHNTRNRGIIEHLNNGMKFAKDFLGSESVALKVAEFVVKAFNPGGRRSPSSFNSNDNSASQEDSAPNSSSYSNEKLEQDSQDEPLNPLRQLARLFGLQPTQLSAVAVNALLFIAQMISTLLMGDRNSKNRLKPGDPSSWILNKKSRSLQDIIATAKDDTLPTMIEELINEQGTEEETSCIRLLVCKIMPFVTKMQKTVFGKAENSEKFKNVRGASIFYRHLPTTEEINARGEACEKKHSQCDLNND